MKASEVLSRVNGISTPIGGVQWVPPQPDVTVARRVLVFLEDRRVLYEPYEAEMPDRCVESVLIIRGFLTEQLAADGVSDEVGGYLRTMRAACRTFLRGVPDVGRMRWDDPFFNQALGQLRGAFGQLIAELAIRYGLDVPDELDPILPAEDVDEGDDWFARPRG